MVSAEARLNWPIAQAPLMYVKSKSKPDIAVRNGNYHTATGNHMPYECYLPPGRGDFPAFTPAEAGTAEAGTRFSDPRGMQG